MENMPEGLQGGFQTTPESALGFNLWHWMKVQEVHFVKIKAV